MLMTPNDQRSEAKLQYGPNGFRVLRPGTHVFCAATGEAIPLDGFLKIRWIRPEDVEHYEAAGVEHIKLIERVNVDEIDLPRLAKTYLERDFDGNLLSLMYAFEDESSYLVNIPNKKLNGFLKFWLHNDPDCRYKCGGECTYCETFLDRRAEEVGDDLMRERTAQFFEFGIVEQLGNAAVQRIALEARL